jgi:hypothetical protein
VPKLSTRILDNLDKITSSLRGESNCDSEMQLQAGSPVLESAAIASIQVVATEDLNFENPTRDSLLILKKRKLFNIFKIWKIIKNIY